METDADGHPISYNLWGANGIVAQFKIKSPLERGARQGGVCYFHADELGSSLALTDGSGRPVSEFAYSPYGKILARTGTAKTPYLYIGGHGVYYEGLNLYNMKARFYDSYLTRFINKDPIGIEGGYNLYLYANANPLVYIDSLGWCSDGGGMWNYFGNKILGIGEMTVGFLGT